MQKQLIEAIKWQDQALKCAQEIRKKQLQRKGVALQAAELIRPDKETTGPSHAARQARGIAAAQQHPRADDQHPQAGRLQYPSTSINGETTSIHRHVPPSGGGQPTLGHRLRSQNNESLPPLVRLGLYGGIQISWRPQSGSSTVGFQQPTANGLLWSQQV